MNDDNKRYRVHNTKSIRVNTIEYFQSGTGLFYFLIFFFFFFGYYEYPIHKIKNLTFFGFFKYFLFQNHNYKHVQTNTMLSRRFLKVHTQVKPGLYLYLPF